MQNMKIKYSIRGTFGEYTRNSMTSAQRGTPCI